MEKHIKMLSLYIATLRAMTIIHSSSHWLSQGNAFYAHHLLFERIYNSALEDLDAAAERFVGLFGDEVLSYDQQNQLLHDVISMFSKYEGSPCQMSLAIEKQFLKLSSNLTNYLAETGGEELLTPGLKNLLEEIASHREEAVYLLQQTLEAE